jgi:hypothetical protein
MLLPRIDFGKRQRVGMQVAFSLVLIAALWCAYWTTGRVRDSVPWTGLKGENSLPGWAAILFPILAIIPGVYVFLFLKYNFNK